MRLNHITFGGTKFIIVMNSKTEQSRGMGWDGMRWGLRQMRNYVTDIANTIITAAQWSYIVPSS